VVFVHKNKKDSLDTSSSTFYMSIKYWKGVEYVFYIAIFVFETGKQKIVEANLKGTQL
jgi:hypothetical protein